MTTIALSPQALRDTFSAYPTGIAFTGGHADGSPAGMLTNSFTSVSLDPPLISVSFAKTSNTWPALRDLKELGISVLSAENIETAELLRRPTSERFNAIDYSSTPAERSPFPERPLT